MKEYWLIHYHFFILYLFVLILDVLSRQVSYSWNVRSLAGSSVSS